jgi:hypothetical protein
LCPNLGQANIQITPDFYAHVLADQRDAAAETVDELRFAAQLSRRSLPRS